MANLGNLWFSVGLKDETDKDWDKIVKRVEQRGAKLGLTVDGQKLQREINAAIAGKKYTIDLSVAVKDNQIEAAIRNAYNRLTNLGGATTQTRPSSEAQLVRADAYSKAQAQLERSRKALADLREARLRDAEAARQQRNANDTLGKSMRKTSGIAGTLRNQLLNLYSIYTIESFLGSLIQVGGEFQKQHIALQAMLGDAAKADTIFSQIKELAVESPFNFQNLTGYAKQLAAFSIPYEELYETTKRLADISSGLGIDMGRIILAYGQVRSAEFLRGTELRQFTEAGIPLLTQLADKFTELEGRVVSVGEVFDKISMREVPFEMVKEVLWDLTNEGGQFYKMQEVLTESLSGKLDKLKDSYQIMLSTIANSNNGIIGGGLDMLTNLTGHWETFLDILYSVIAAWGAYKAVVVLANVTDAIKIIRIQGITAALNANTVATLANARAQNGAALGGVKLLGTVSKLKTALSSISGVAGGWGIALSALAAIGTYAYNAYQEANKLRNELEEIDEKAAGNIESLVYGYQRLVSQLKGAKQGTMEYASIVKQINSSYGQYLDNLFSEAEAYENIANSVNKVTEAIVKKVQNQAYEQKVSAITENYTDKLADMQKDVADRIESVYRVNSSLAKQMAQDFTDFIKQGDSSEEAMKKVAQIWEKGYKSLRTVEASTIQGMSTPVYIDVASNYASLYKEFQSQLEQATQSQVTRNPYSRELDKIKQKWDEINKSAKSEEEERLNTIKMYEEQMAKLRSMGAPEKDATLTDIKQRKEALENLKDSWYSIAHAINEARETEGKKGISPGYLPTLKQGEQEQNIAYFESLAKAAAQAQEIINKLSLIPEKNRTDANKSSLESAKALLDFVKEYAVIQNKNTVLAHISGRDAYAPMVLAENKKNESFMKQNVDLMDEVNVG